MSVEFLIGADPELFVRDRAGKLVSAYGMIPGTKEAPFKVEGGAVQVDGMALEFNIDPANNLKDFNNNIVNVLRQLQEMIPNGYSFDFSPVAEFGKEYIDNQPEAARELGCNPDFDASTGLPNPKPNANYPFRTASGHIHIGWTSGQDVAVPEHIEACHMAVKQLDCTVGLASRKWDKDLLRTQMYGNLGAYRPKSYGVEYRTLSNTWVNHEDRRKFVFSLAMRAMELLMSGTRIYDSYHIPDFQRGIDKSRWGNIDQYVSNIISKYANELYDKYLNIETVVAEIKKKNVLSDIDFGLPPDANLWDRAVRFERNGLLPIPHQRIGEAEVVQVLDDEFEIEEEDFEEEMEIFDEDEDEDVPVVLRG